tara:strand:+ start:299 stop:1009 length:711 start_codon:yes stop_codon:yes gene_type:complete
MDLNIVTNEDSNIACSGSDKANKQAPTMEDKSMIDSLGSKPLQMIIDEEEISTPKVDNDKPIMKEEDTVKVDPIDDKVIFGLSGAEDDSEPEPVIKKVRSEKQREHLKKAREKALATRQAKAKVKKEEAEVKRLERETKREEAHKLKLLREDKEFETKKKIQESVPPPKQNKSFTEEDIMLIQQKAIDTYEKKRKAEKKIRKEEESKVKQEALIHQKVARAVQRDPNDDIWGSCFN